MSSQEEIVIVDATNQILGRMSTHIAKLLKSGKKVYVVNAEKAIISGPRSRVLEGYSLLFTVKTMQNPYRQGIRRPRNPINIVKRTVRGMLPKNKLGKQIYRNLKAYIGIPKELEGKSMIRFDDADVSRLKGKYITVAELSRLLGGLKQ
ncbi:50S ribosomal protein L13 [Sulfolobus acidocaldarius]|uniref:Large ribosomal subunit protein uL13 n=5 Tax=Sulfolobus acidocaldarius TaxID=2285 RepID=RL13_SULAC|nr:50S ribosomal protein L13 [Sulfolobus acidocaldarius]P39473.2 RecName: Full=Large ribosomal subunit protein uL13; AltName: Full=50S ribosomal protein L13 [Sulfolobus acidocaldarius DSM 639]AAY79512.1 50S ribosomal protein L13P [Sulfolobus acidocaldarius DSM 639]AGE70061.1 50S ribosomal protein L13P [Sulfolobus acidocaldarius N8]AGE72336.1 50S ribosomal protein L13P [Sulfolobus acidocaldarius Ron12/I]ALU29513.1 50S ribosomal protein L13 [Sulfolobus acidocaldarius]ALU32243.1 50S ribosomal pr